MVSRCGHSGRVEKWVDLPVLKNWLTVVTQVWRWPVICLCHMLWGHVLCWRSLHFCLSNVLGNLCVSSNRRLVLEIQCCRVRDIGLKPRNLHTWEHARYGMHVRFAFYSYASLHFNHMVLPCYIFCPNVVAWRKESCSFGLSWDRSGDAGA